MLFTVEIIRETPIGNVDRVKLHDALMRFSYLIGYVSTGYKETENTHTLTAGTPMSLNPNTIRHTIDIDYRVGGTMTFSVRARALPWARSKIRDIVSYRLVQLLGYLCSQGLLADDSISAVERGVHAEQEPFSHLACQSVYCGVTSLIKMLLAMAFCIGGVILTMWIYGALIIGIEDGRLLLEVTFGTISKAKLVGGASVIGIAIGYAVGAVLSVYFALSETIEYLNRRILSFALFYAVIMCIFIIEEEAVIVTSVLAVALPFIAYAFYCIVWGLKKVYIKGDDE